MYIPYLHTSSSSRIHVMTYNWSATKQHLHPQSVAEISRHSVLSEDNIRQCATSSGSRHKSLSRHFLLQAPQCQCSVRKRSSRNHIAEEGQNPVAGLWGCRLGES